MKNLILIIFTGIMLLCNSSKTSKSSNQNKFNDNDFIIEYKKRFKNNHYKIKFEKNCDLNKDGLFDKIFVFECENLKNNESVKNSPVCILINSKNSYSVYENKNIIYTSFVNSLAEGFQDLIIKNNFFTVEQNTGANSNRINEYVTFIFDLKLNKIILHKYAAP